MKTGQAAERVKVMMLFLGDQFRGERWQEQVTLTLERAIEDAREECARIAEEYGAPDVAQEIRDLPRP